MSAGNYITSFCKISSGSVNVNHSIGFSENSESAAAFLKLAYKHYQLSYPKFYKMDQLSQTAILASELLFKENRITERYNKEDIAIIVANSASSLEIDTEHQVTISDETNYFPSPAVFVYTLPNILIGEIAIRNNIKGENTFFIFDKFDSRFMSNYVNSLLDTGKAECCIAGWVEFFENKMDAFLYTVEKQKGVLAIEHSSEQLNKLYAQ